MAKSCRNRSFVEIGLSYIFTLFRSLAGQPIVDSDEPTHTDMQRQRCTETAVGMETEER